MKTILLMSMLSLTLMACDRLDKPESSTTTTTSTTNTPVGKDYDNTGKNIRDRDSTRKTPFDQSESEADRTITQKIRQTLMSDDSLSTNAKNIKIVTINGVVTLRGPVASEEEKDDVASKVKVVQGIIKVDNQLDITRNNY
jgi:hypothetical protein